ncbi:hypothetical protein [Desulfoglaeba alkanexedens]|uniref:hypothetical protein n=1 Tax=Desulfoglaeba alkanexedens TaxID=361111 RepID=UPI001476D550|nr:hypothetical protein [Desulfoglaeba alkanexedens]
MGTRWILELGNKVDTLANRLDIVRDLDLPRDPADGLGMSIGLHHCWELLKSF